MNQKNRTITSPMKITLEMHATIMTWEGPWDSCFENLFVAFIGLCSTGGFGDKTELYKCVINSEPIQNIIEDIE